MLLQDITASLAQHFAPGSASRLHPERLHLPAKLPAINSRDPHLYKAKWTRWEFKCKLKAQRLCTVVHRSHQSPLAS
eukprot:2559945-Amphidinium_carterae.1